MDQVLDADGTAPEDGWDGDGRAGPVFTYSRPEQPWLRRWLIRTVETLSGRNRFERLYLNWRQRPRNEAETIFTSAIRELAVRAEVSEADLARIPASGGVLVVANHPYGIIDGLLAGEILSRRRGDVKLMVHSLLCQPPEAREALLPVDFGAGPEARRTSAETRRRAVDWLEAGHVLIIFPAGSVSTAPAPLARHAVDGEWHPFVARLAARRGVAVLPLFIGGQNSRLFQIVSHWSYPLRVALIFHETRRRLGRAVPVVLGPVLRLAGEDKATLAGRLRDEVYGMAGPDGPQAGSVFHWPARIRW